jgi:hypothetical protein
VRSSRNGGRAGIENVLLAQAVRVLSARGSRR